MSNKKKKSTSMSKPGRPIPATVSELRNAPYNPRSIRHKAAVALTVSMKEFGDISGFVFNVRTGLLVCGHQRKKYFPPDTPIIGFKTQGDACGTVGYGFMDHGGQRWSIRFVDWDEELEKAANVAANSKAVQGEFTSELTSLLDGIKTELPDVYDQTLMHELMDLTDSHKSNDPRASSENGAPEYDLAPEMYESYNYVVLFFKNEIDWLAAVEHFGLKRVRAINDRKIGLGSVIDGSEYLKQRAK